MSQLFVSCGQSIGASASVQKTAVAQYWKRVAYGTTNKEHWSKNEEIRDALRSTMKKLKPEGLRILPCRQGEVGSLKQRKLCGQDSSLYCLIYLKVAKWVDIQCSHCKKNGNYGMWYHWVARSMKYLSISNQPIVYFKFTQYMPTISQ